jgi:FAD binding domain-containing protein/berberine-like enzyme
MAVTQATLAPELGERLRGEVIGRDDPRYDEARQIHNAMIDKRPAAVARCMDTGDVMATVRFAREHGVELAVRGGGHSAAGMGCLDDGIVVDLSQQRWVHVNPKTGRVHAGGGALLGDVDHATAAFGLAVPLGVLSTTGIGGLVTGGGIGYLARKYGLSIDNLLSADVVLADGSFAHASEDENADLFWALRGGGGNFGVVTTFEFQAHPVSTIIGGPTLWHLDRAAEVMAFWRDFMETAPEELGGFFAFVTVPPGPPFPEHLHLHKMCGVVWCWTGDPEKSDEVFAPVREQQPALDGLHAAPFAGLQGAFDPLFPPGLQLYWRGDFVDELSDEAIATHAELAPTLPTMLSTMHMYPIDGAAARVAPDATAFGYRGSRYSEVILGADPEPANAQLIRDWCVNYYDRTHPFAAAGGGGYVNFNQDTSDDRVRAAYGPNYDRLAQIKAKYDPDNVFHINHNIKPA